MSSVWAKLEALAAAGDPAKFTKCPCGDHSDQVFHPDPGGPFPFDPTRVEGMSGGREPLYLARSSDLVDRIARRHSPWNLEELPVGLGAAAAWEAREGLGTEGPPAKKPHEMCHGLGLLPPLLAMNQSYRVPHSAEEERQRFRQDLWDVIVAARVNGTQQKTRGYPKEMRALEQQSVIRLRVPLAPGGSVGLLHSVEELVWHYDPRLQLIHFPSFRCFIEVDSLRQNLRFTEKRLYSPNQVCNEEIDIAAANIFFLYTVGAECVFYYATAANVMKTEAKPEPAPALPAAAEEAEEAGPSLSKAQRKRAQQKASKAAARLAKEAATSTSRSDYLPKLPAPKPLTAASKKKQKKGPRAQEAAAEAAGGSWAVVESGVEGQDKSAPSQCLPKPASKKPPIGEPLTGQPSSTAQEPAAAKPPVDEPAKESPEPQETFEATPGPKAEEAAESVASAPLSTPPEAVVDPPLGPVSPAAPPSLPVVEAVGPSWAYALLADDLYRITDRLRKARLARRPR